MLLVRPVNANRPTKGKISTPEGWISVSLREFGNVEMEAAEANGGLAIRVLKRHGFKEYTPPGPGPAPTVTRDDTPVSVPDLHEDDAGSLLDGPARTVIARLGDTYLSEEKRHALIAAERRGKNRVTVLRELGADV